MNRVWLVAHLTFIEGVRARAIYGILIVALMMIAGTMAIVNLFAFDLGKVAMDLILSVIALTGLLLTFFVNINLMAKDMDKRTIFSVLSRPVSRKEYIIGKYAGFCFLVAASIMVLAGIGGISLVIIKSCYPQMYFKNFSWLCYTQAVGFEILMFCMLNAGVIFFSTITTSSFLTLLFSIAMYVIGQSVEDVVLFLQSRSIIGSGGSEMNRLFLEAIQYIVPNFNAFDIKITAGHGLVTSLTESLMLLGYSACYSGVLILFAILIFERRELQ